MYLVKSFQELGREMNMLKLKLKVSLMQLDFDFSS